MGEGGIVIAARILQLYFFYLITIIGATGFLSFHFFYKLVQRFFELKKKFWTNSKITKYSQFYSCCVGWQLFIKWKKYSSGSTTNYENQKVMLTGNKIWGNLTFGLSIKSKIMADNFTGQFLRAPSGIFFSILASLSFYAPHCLFEWHVV